MNLFSRLLFFLSKREKFEAVGLLLLMLIASVFEAIGIALIFPLIAVISDPEAIRTQESLAYLYSISEFGTVREFMLWLVGVVFAVYLLKYVYLALLYYIQYRYIFRLQEQLSVRLFSAYLRSPYTYHLKKNSAELLRNVNSEVLWIFSGVLIPALTSLIEVMIVVIILAVLVVTSLLPTIAAVAILGGASFGFYLFIRKRAATIGQVQQAYNGEMIKWVNQGLGGIKETKILHRESYFIDAYANNSRGYARAMRYLRTLSEFPRLMIEGLVFGGILLTIGSMLYSSQNVVNIVPTLGLFAMASVRLMPSINRILTGLTSIRYYSASVNKVYSDLVDLEIKDQDRPSKDGFHESPGISFEKEIVIANVSYSYPDSRESSLTDVSLTIERGHSIALVGTSGAGKTTLVDIILGLLTPPAGRVLVDGIDIDLNIADWQKKIGYIPQPIYISDDTIARNVAFGVLDDDISSEKVWRALRAAQLDQFVCELAGGLDSSLGENGISLSAGQRQRIGIARALYNDPEILVLDEATAALDNETELEITKAIVALGRSKTVIAIAHRLSTVKSFDRIYLMKNGAIVAADNFDGLQQSSEEFRRMLDPEKKRENE